MTESGYTTSPVWVGYDRSAQATLLFCSLPLPYTVNISYARSFAFLSIFSTGVDIIKDKTDLCKNTTAVTACGFEHDHIEQHADGFKNSEFKEHGNKNPRDVVPCRPCAPALRKQDINVINGINTFQPFFPILVNILHLATAITMDSAIATTSRVCPARLGNKVLINLTNLSSLNNII